MNPKKVFSLMLILLVSFLSGLFAVLIFLAGVAPYTLLAQQEKSMHQEFPSVIPSVLNGQISAESKTRILILGTIHLRQLEDRFRPEMLDSLIDVLDKFKPDVIAIETPPDSLIREMKHRRDESSLVAEVLNGFAGVHLKLGDAAQEELGISYSEAVQFYRNQLRESDSTAPNVNALDRRCQIILSMLAAYNMDSALLQWSYLTQKEKQNQRLIPRIITEVMEQQLNRVNEIPALAIRLARKLHLQCLYPADDFEDLDAIEEILPLLEKEVSENVILKSAKDSSIYLEAKKSLDKAVEQGDLLPHFQFLNSRKYAEADVQAQWGAFLRTKLKGGVDRSRLGLWETRNLKIASRVRTISAMHPGRNILIIYGAGHKPFLEAYLGCLIDIQVIRLEDLIFP